MHSKFSKQHIFSVRSLFCSSIEYYSTEWLKALFYYQPEKYSDLQILCQLKIFIIKQVPYKTIKNFYVYKLGVLFPIIVKSNGYNFPYIIPYKAGLKSSLAEKFI